jgi:hypothetical protein
VGLFGFLRRNDERAIPEPGSPEFEAAVQGSALPDTSSGQSVSMGQSGWASPTERQTIDLRGSGAREEILDALRAHGIDPDQKGQTINAGSIPGLTQEILAALGGSGVQIPNAGGFGGAVMPPRRDEISQLEHLAEQRDAGKITDAEFEAQKKRLLEET